MLMRGLLLLLNTTGVPRLVYRLMLDRRVPLVTKLIIPAGILYLVSPIDLVPDIVPALGRIDDVLVLAFSILLFLLLAPMDVIREHLRGGRGGGDGPDGGSGRVIEGSYRIKDEVDELMAEIDERDGKSGR